MSSSAEAGSEVLEITAIVTALAFFAGWEYSRAYYDALEVRSGMLQIDVPTYFVWAYRPLEERWYLALVAIAGLTALNHLRKALSGWRLYAVNLGLLVALLLLFPAIASVSREVGNRDASENLATPRDSFPLVVIHLKDPEKASKDAFRSGVGPVHGGEYFLIGRHHDTYLLLPPTETRLPSPMFVPADALSAVLIRR